MEDAEQETQEVRENVKKKRLVIPFSEIRKDDVSLVGGKTASLGEMISIGLPVPDGFAVSAEAYRHFIEENQLDEKIREAIGGIDTRDMKSLMHGGRKIREMIEKASIPEELEKEILSQYKKLGSKYVAVRSSATAEDLPDASFAGQQESFLNVTEKNLVKSVHKCFASLFTDRAISYREDKKFDHFKVFLTVAVQKQIFSEASGVMFTIDPDSGHRNFIVINASYGLGDYIVQGVVTPDEFMIFKHSCRIVSKKLGKKHVMEVRSTTGVKEKKVPDSKRDEFCIKDREAEELAKYGKMIESHYKMAMDTEWAKENGKLFILQARPETVHSNKESHNYEIFKLKEKGSFFVTGSAVGRKIASGVANVIEHPKDINNFRRGQILVTKRTDPDWEPIMKMASGIVTEDGGRTSHAAIVSRELGVPAVLGVKNATKVFKTGQHVTIDCSSHEGRVWKGSLKFSVNRHEIKRIPDTATKVMVNTGIPDEAIDVSFLPVDGIGLVREEFILGSMGTHPLQMIKEKREHEFIETLGRNIAKIAASFYPREVIVRFSDFKSNEYSSLKGGAEFEPKEENPMIGWRGASRYISKSYEEAFRLEVKAMRMAIEMIGTDNIKVMIPFCRTLSEARKTLNIIRGEGLKSEVYVMAEIPSNIILAEEFCKLFDGFSIGSNDLTQLTLGIDRDNELLSEEFDERNEAVKILIKQLIETAHRHGRKVGICGDAPSTHEEYASFLVECGIDSISVTPDVALQTKLGVARLEEKKRQA